MTQESIQTQLLPHQKILKFIVLGFLFASALATRIYVITDPATEFHPLRQYRAALIARGLYFSQVAESVPEWRQEIARLNIEQQGSLEPAITENLAVMSYRIAGGEYLWLPRLFSVFFWLVGGVFLYRLAEKLLSSDQALFATAFYLLLPFSVIASRSFQPDPLMIMLMLGSLNLVWWYHEKPSNGRLVLVGLLSSLAPFVKPICIFVILMAFVMLSFYRRRTWRGIVNLPIFVFAILLLLPTGLYYFSGILGGTALQDEAQAQFLPGLLIERFFWAGWFTQIGKVVGAVPFVGALLGLAIAPRKHPVIFFLTGMWIGYLLMGLLFTYTIFSHDYYQLQLIPIVALCLSALLAPTVQQVARLYHQPAARAALLCLLFVLAASFSVTENWWRAFSRVYYESVDRVVAQIGPEIGQTVEHSSKTIILTGADDGLPLEYYAEISGAIWPSVNDMQGLRLQGYRLPASQEMFDAYLHNANPDFFIVTNWVEVERQPELKQLLGKLPVLIQTQNYIIYDLRTPRED